MAPNTRSSRQQPTNGTRAAELAIARGGNRELRRMLGVSPKKRAPRKRTAAKTTACEAELARAQRRVAALERIVKQLKEGRAKTAARAAVYVKSREEEPQGRVRRMVLDWEETGMRQAAPGRAVRPPLPAPLRMGAPAPPRRSPPPGKAAATRPPWRP